MNSHKIRDAPIENFLFRVILADTDKDNLVVRPGSTSFQTAARVASQDRVTL